MRRGCEAGDCKIGGAWHCAARLRAEKSRPKNSLDSGAITNRTAAVDVLCPDESCTKGPCVVGMALQQSWP